MAVVMHPQGMLGVSFNYLHNQGPADWTLLPSHFSFRLYSFGAYSVHSNKLHLPIFCKQCFNSWVTAAICLCLGACCGAEEDTCCGDQVNWVEIEGKLIDEPWLGLVSIRKPKSFIRAVRFYVCNKDLCPLYFLCLCFILTKVVLWTWISQISCAVLKWRK